MLNLAASTGFDSSADLVSAAAWQDGIMQNLSLAFGHQDILSKLDFIGRKLPEIAPGPQQAQERLAMPMPMPLPSPPFSPHPPPLSAPPFLRNPSGTSLGCSLRAFLCVPGAPLDHFGCFAPLLRPLRLLSLQPQVLHSTLLGCLTFFLSSNPVFPPSTRTYAEIGRGSRVGRGPRGDTIF